MILALIVWLVGWILYGLVIDVQKHPAAFELARLAFMMGMLAFLLLLGGGPSPHGIQLPDFHFGR